VVPVERNEMRVGTWMPGQLLARGLCISTNTDPRPHIEDQIGYRSVLSNLAVDFDGHVKSSWVGDDLIGKCGSSARSSQPDRAARDLQPAKQARDLVERICRNPAKLTSIRGRCLAGSRRAANSLTLEKHH
jgi:hypothetical protein